MASVRIIECSTPALIGQAADLFREYAASLPFSLCFQGFDEELLTLPGKYGPPSGCLLLAVSEAERDPAGCVAVRELDRRSRICEMKRLYVRPAARGHGVGIALCEEIVQRARTMGYRAMKLDTSADMHAAHAVYRRLGFVPCERYNDDPLPDTQYFELVLRDRS